MEAICDISALRRAVAAAGEVIPHSSESALAAYTALLLRARPERLEVIGADGELAIGIHIPATVTTAGQQPLPYRAFQRWLDATSATQVAVTRETGGALLSDPDTGHQTRFHPPAVTVPDLTLPAQEPVAISGYGLRRAARNVQRSVGTADAVQLRSTDLELALVATDNHRLTRVVVPGSGFGRFEGLLPTAGISLLEQHPLEAVGDTGDGALWFHGQDRVLRVPLVDRPFPLEAGELLDRAAPVRLELDRADAAVAVGELGAFAGEDPEELVPVRGRVEGRTVTFSVDQRGVGRASRQLTAGQADGVDSQPPLPFAVSWRFLSDALEVHTADTVTLELQEGVKPVVLRSGGQLPTTVVISPVLL